MNNNFEETLEDMAWDIVKKVDEENLEMLIEEEKPSQMPPVGN